MQPDTFILNFFAAIHHSYRRGHARWCRQGEHKAKETKREADEQYVLPSSIFFSF